MSATAQSRMAALPTGRTGQVLAVLLLLLVAAAAWQAAAAPLLDLYADRAEALAQRQALARRMAAIAAGLPDLQRQASQAATGPAPASLLEGGSDAVAGAALQQMVQDMAARAGAALSSIEALPAEPAGGHRRVAVRVSASATLPSLVRLLVLVGDATPAMLVDDLQLHGARAQGGSAELPMDATLTIFGFLAGGA